MAHPNFFAELKRRNVYKVAVAYAVVAWLLIQAASITSVLAGAAPATRKTESLAGARPSIPDQWIAVLPFGNLSEEKVDP
jgi:hypothetical protein